MKNTPFDSEKFYREKVNAIFNRFPSVQKVGFDQAYKPGLEHMRAFAALLGNPQETYRTVHVAGTNGKGSVSSMLASVLSGTGIRVGLYTSPHLVDFRERMRVVHDSSAAVCASEEEGLIPKEYVYDFLCRYEAEMERLNLSFFEITTGMAFKWFADAQVDVAVIEVGLGGRLDSTNIITPELSVVTTIGLDHCEQLGNTLASIAGEKAGIFKKNVPALVGETVPETRPVFEAKAEGLCPLAFAQDAEPSLWFRREEILRQMDLRGRYQEKNLRTVLAAVDLLKALPNHSALSDTEKLLDAIEHAAARTGFHGRWERVSSRPAILADIGHNSQALTENFAQLKQLIAEKAYTSLIIVYGIMADKDLDGILPLLPENATYVFTSPAIHRALPYEQLAARYRTFCKQTGRPEKIHSAETVREAIDTALLLASREACPLIYIGGSAYLIAEALPVLHALRPPDPWRDF